RGRRLGSERDRVAGHDHAGEAEGHPAQPARPPRRFGRDGGGDSHLQHAVSDHPGQADRSREIIVEMDRVLVTGRFRVIGDLLASESDPPLAHDRITKRARERHTGEPFWSVVSVSNDTKRMPRRLESEATRPRETMVSPSGVMLRHLSLSAVW